MSTTTRRGGPGWVYACIGIHLLCQLALLVQELEPLRVFIRAAAFVTSLSFLVLVPAKVRGRGVVRMLALGAVTILSLSALNPFGGAPLAVMAHWTLYLAILAPIFWVARLDIPSGTIGRILLTLWVFHTAGSVLGVLQVYFPGHFQPSLTNITTPQSHLLIRLASGEWMPRPTGLTDTPGGASANGLFASLLGIGVSLARPFRFARVAGAASIGLGTMCIYLSQVRSAFVMLVICLVVLVSLFTLTGRSSRATTLMLLVGVVASVGFYFALGVGGEMMSRRLSSLIAADPGTVYYQTRGNMLEDALIDQLPRYPLGAGLGHWGMMNSYFGSVEHEIGAEIQISGWILDGGLPLLLTYLSAVIAAIFLASRASRSKDDAEATWASVVAAYSVGALALCFSYPVFMGNAGLEFWLTNAVLLQEIRRRPSTG